MQIKEAIILAGGLGTRLRSVVNDVPKAMAPVSHKPFLEYLLEFWSGQGITHFVLSTGYLSDKIEAHFGKKWQNARISYSRETSPQGTGGGLILAADLTEQDDFLVLNGDTLCEVPLFTLAKFHHQAQSDITVVTSQGIHSGVAVVKASVFDEVPHRGKPLSVENDLLPYWKDRGKRVSDFPFEAGFIDIGTPEGYRLFIDSIGLRDTLGK